LTITICYALKLNRVLNFLIPGDMQEYRGKSTVCRNLDVRFIQGFAVTQECW